MKDIKVAVAQMEIINGKVKENLKKIELFTARAAKQNAEIILFPEVSISGWLEGDNIYDIAEPVPGPSTKKLSNLARTYKVILLAGISELGQEGVVYITHVVVGPEGLIGKYRKVHVHGEFKYYRHGNKFKIFGLPKANISINICYDSWFPESSRIVTLMGAEIIFAPHHFGESEKEFMKYLPARARDNGVYFVFANAVGEDASGGSRIFDPYGNVIVKTSNEHKEDLLTATLTGQELKKCRIRSPYPIRRRRPEHYSILNETEL